MDDELRARLRSLPAVDRVLDALDAPHDLAAHAAREAVDAARRAIMDGEETWPEERVIAEARSLLTSQRRSMLRPVVNATGVLIHTNLGRTPLGVVQLEAVARASGGYSNLEYDLESGRRGNRYRHARALVSALTGSEAALIVNNNAAAVLLVASSLAAGRGILVSRGELVEIGGEFRIPDVIEASGARLQEVGTTNRTHLPDFERAIEPDTAMILKVHPSNFRVIGFTRDVPARDLARLAKGRGLCFVHDLGSGLVSERASGLDTRNEPLVRAALEEGADLVTFSGDKLLGGPQAGVIAGRADLIEKTARNPLLRALRVDKMTLAALEATLLLYLEHREREIPLWTMVSAPSEMLEQRARTLATRIESSNEGGGMKVEAVPGSSLPGGGSLPGTELPSWAVSIAGTDVDDLARGLREHDPPVIARIEDDRVLLDLRTIAHDQDDIVAEALFRVLGG